MTERDNPPFQIGFRKPPKHTQFAKGRSGNPKGRGKGVKNFATDIQDELNSRLAVTENGRRRKITKRKAVAKQLVNRAAAGVPKAMPVLLNEARQHEAGAAIGPDDNVLSQPEDKLVMASIVKRIREADIASADALPETRTDNLDIGTPPPETGRAP